MAKICRTPASKIPADITLTAQPAPMAAPPSARPTRKAKQAVLEQKVWTNDLPATRKRALLSAMDEAQSVQPKKVKRVSNPAKSSGGHGSTECVLDKERKVDVPPRFARKNVLLVVDFNSSGEDDIPLSAARACSAPKALATPLSEKTTYVKDLQDPCDDDANSEGDISDDDVDPEACEQAIAEQSESDDEVFMWMEARGDTDVLGAHLAAEQPEWSQPKQHEKALQIRIALDNKDKQATGTSKVVQEKSNHVGEKKATGLTKTELRTQQECPVLKTPALQTSHVYSTTAKSSLSAAPAPTVIPALPTAARNDHPSDSDSDSDLEMVDAMQPHDYHVIYPMQGGPLSLKVQHPDIQDAIQATITHLERKILFEDAFPDAHKHAQFLKSLASIPNQRISSFHGKIKDKSNVAITSFFGLVPGQAMERVEWLLPHLTYVYPTDFEKWQVIDSQPYRAPIVINVLHESFFKGAKSFYGRNEAVFASSLPGRVEREIPLTMLALIGVAIHASLIDWRSGDCVEASHFSADRYLDAYTEHKILLNEIKKSAPVKYHTMMYKLFNEASGGPVHVAPLGVSAIAHLNLDAMEED